MKDQLVTKKILNWYDLNRRSLPWRRNVSFKKKQYFTLISEFMLQQTQVVTVIPYFNRFIKEVPNLISLSKIPNKKLIKLWEGLGYYSRARNLKKTAQVVIKNFPRSSKPTAKLAAQYALAAHKQGKYKEMYHKIFEKYQELRNNPKLPEQIAAELNLDVEKLIADINSNDILSLIDEEKRQLTSLENAYKTKEYAGVRVAVPKFFINGREPAGRRSLATFSKVIEEELSK